MATFEIKGLKEVNRALKDLPDRVARKVVRQSIRASLKPVQAAVQSAAPVLAGATKEAVKVRATKGKRGSIGLEVRIGKGDYRGDQYYASFVEFGTKKQKAQHFMERAFDATAASARADAERQILAGLLAEADALGRS